MSLKLLLNRDYYTIARDKYKLLLPELDAVFVRVSRFPQIIAGAFVQYDRKARGAVSVGSRRA